MHTRLFSTYEEWGIETPTGVAVFFSHVASYNYAFSLWLRMDTISTVTKIWKKTQIINSCFITVPFSYATGSVNRNARDLNMKMVGLNCFILFAVAM